MSQPEQFLINSVKKWEKAGGKGQNSLETRGATAINPSRGLKPFVGATSVASKGYAVMYQVCEFWENKEVPSPTGEPVKYAMDWLARFEQYVSFVRLSKGRGANTSVRAADRMNYQVSLSRVASTGLVPFTMPGTAVPAHTTFIDINGTYCKPMAFAVRLDQAAAKRYTASHATPPPDPPAAPPDAGQ